MGGISVLDSVETRVNLISGAYDGLSEEEKARFDNFFNFLFDALQKVYEKVYPHSDVALAEDVKRIIDFLDSHFEE